MPRTATPKAKLGDRQLVIAGGAALLAAAAATTGAVLMRRQLAKLAVHAATEALSAGHVLEAKGERLGKSMMKEMKRVDLAQLLTLVGLRRRPSLLSRLLLPIGVTAGLAAAAGSAIFLFGPKLPRRSTEKPETVTDKVSAPMADGVSTNSYSSTNGSSITELEETPSHATR